MSEDIKKWLREGKQSKITSKIKEIASQFKGNEFEKIVHILEWIDKNLHSEENRKKVLDIFASRTTDQLIQEKNDTGCHDTALLLVTFLRAVDIPAKYIVGIDRLSPSRGGHVVAEAYVGKRWVLIDPSYFQLNLIPSRSYFYRQNYIVNAGLDSWDCGIKTHSDWNKASNKLIKHIEKFKF